MNSRAETRQTGGEGIAVFSPLGGSKRGQNRDAFPTTPGGLKGGAGEFSGSYTATGQPASRVQSSLFAARLPPGRSVSIVTLFSRRVSLVSVPGGFVTVVTLVRLVRVGRPRVRLVRVLPPVSGPQRERSRRGRVSVARQCGVSGAGVVLTQERGSLFCGSVRSVWFVRFDSRAAAIHHVTALGEGLEPIAEV